MKAVRALFAALSLVTFGLAGCGGPTPSTPSARPRPAAPGTPIGVPSSLGVGSAGGRLASDDGRLVLDIPAGVVTGPADFTIQALTNLAPGGVGSAYRLGPEGTLFPAPVTLTFHTELTGKSFDALSVAWQEGQGYWLRVPQSELTRDAAKKTITVTTRHFSGWTLVTGPTARDLHGTFTLDSTLDLPFAGATGSASFTFAGEDPGVAYYLLSGTITLPSPLALGTDSCVPTAPQTPTLALKTNIAELRASPPAFLWGTSGHWDLTCTGPSGTRADLLVTAFDTQGISHFNCARGYDGGSPLVLGPERVQGTWALDCGARGSASASWNFQSNACGAACTSADPCHTAVLECATGVGVCTDNGLVPDGEPGGCPSPQLCLGGVCVP